MTALPITLVERVAAVRGGARVERCHGIPHVGSYSNATHQWGVAHLCHVFWPDRPHLVVAALFHDTPEAWVGDIPSPVMRHIPGIRDSVAKVEKRLTDAMRIPSEHDLDLGDFNRLKACDRLEFLLWCLDQSRIGNNEVNSSMSEVLRYLDENPPPEAAGVFYRELRFKRYEGHTTTGVIREIAEELKL